MAVYVGGWLGWVRSDKASWGDWGMGEWGGAYLCRPLGALRASACHAPRAALLVAVVNMLVLSLALWWCGWVGWVAWVVGCC